MKYTHRHVKRGFGGVSEIVREDGQILWLVEPGHDEYQRSVHPAIQSSEYGWWEWTYQGSGDYSRPATLGKHLAEQLDSLPWDTKAVIERDGGYYHVANGSLVYEIPLVDFVPREATSHVDDVPHERE